MSAPPSFILYHGAFVNAACWSKIAPSNFPAAEHEDRAPLVGHSMAGRISRDAEVAAALLDIARS